MRILVLDDNELRHEMMGKKLRDRGNEVVQAWNYAEAVQALDGRAFDTLYLDHDLDDFTLMMYGSLERTGVDVVLHLTRCIPKEKFPGLVIVHSWNIDGAHRMQCLLRSAGILVRLEPFKVDAWWGEEV